MKIAVVTGASSGMGREFVKQLPHFYKNLDEIWVIARRRNRLETLQNEVQIPLRILEGDLLSETFFLRFRNILKQERPDVRMLVNSAGFGRYGSVKAIAGEGENIQTEMIDLNCRALVKMTQCVLPYLSFGSRIVNLSSGSAFCPQPNFSVYAATKAFVLHFSRGLETELRKQKIYVTAVCPGPVKTEFFANEGMQPPKWKEPFMAKADRGVYQALLDARKRRTVSVYGPSMKAFRVVAKLLPHTLILKIMGCF